MYLFKKWCKKLKEINTLFKTIGFKTDEISMQKTVKPWNIHTVSGTSTRP